MRACQNDNMGATEESKQSRVFSGTILRRTHTPESGTCGSILMLHGLGDHSGTHLQIAELLSSLGYTVHAFDWPGHGGSSGWRGDIPDLLDAFHLIDEALSLFDSPIAGIYAHSTGAFLFLQYLLWKEKEPDETPHFSRIWLSSPLLRPGHNQSTFKKTAAEWVAKVAPRLPLSTGVSHSQVCHVEHPDVSSTKADFAGCHNLVSARFGFNLIKAEDNILEAASLIPENTRLFLAQGDDDNICPASFAFDLFDRIRVPDKVFFFVSDARHEIFREPMRRSYFSAVRAWFQTD